MRANGKALMKALILSASTSRWQRAPLVRMDAMADAELVQRMDETIDSRTAVTIRQFRAFVRATGHVAFTEKHPTRGDIPGPCTMRRMRTARPHAGRMPGREHQASHIAG